MPVLAGWEHEVLRFDAVKGFGALPETDHQFVCFIVHWNESLARFSFACANQDDPVEKVDIPPLQSLDFTSAHRGAERQRHSGLGTLPILIPSGDAQEPKLLVESERSSNRMRFLQRA
jgi:hypothetical protein